MHSAGQRVVVAWGSSLQRQKQRLQDEEEGGGCGSSGGGGLAPPPNLPSKGAVQGCESVPLGLDVCQEWREPSTQWWSSSCGTHEAFVEAFRREQLAGKRTDFRGAYAVRQLWAKLDDLGWAYENPLVSCIDPPAAGASWPSRALVLGCLGLDSPCKALLNDYQNTEIWGVDVNSVCMFGCVLQGNKALSHNYYADVASGRLKLFREDCAVFVRGCAGELFDTIHMEARNSPWVSAEVNKTNGGNVNGAPTQCLNRKFSDDLFRSLKRGGALVWHLYMFDKGSAEEIALTELLEKAGFTYWLKVGESKFSRYLVAFKP